VGIAVEEDVFAGDVVESDKGGGIRSGISIRVGRRRLRDGAFGEGTYNQSINRE
jgi:hypothetical protein